MAKSVPQRMAIISAGVIMNVIFAFVVAVVAYRMGVKENPCVVGRLLPGDPAWTRRPAPGDEIVRIGDIENPRFRDLQQRVALGDNLDKGVKFVVRRRDGASRATRLHDLSRYDRTGAADRHPKRLDHDAGQATRRRQWRRWEARTAHSSRGTRSRRSPAKT